MENNFKEILPNGLESYDGLEDQMDEDGDFQLKVIKTKIWRKNVVDIIYREGGDIGLFITLIPKVVFCSLA